MRHIWLAPPSQEQEITEPSNPDIVVVGTRTTDGDGNALWVFSHSSGALPGIRDITPDEVSENGEAPPETLEIVVTIDRTTGDPAQMEAAAQALIKAIAKVVDLLKSADPSRVVAVLGVAISLGALLTALQNTNFIITDRTNFGNGGVGGAAINTAGGRNSDQINYIAIVGDATHPAYYNHPNFTNGEGMLALVLHEAFHLTEQGYQFFEASKAAWGNNATFYSSPHAANLERFMNNLTMQALDALSVETRPEAPPVLPLDPPVPIGNL